MRINLYEHCRSEQHQQVLMNVVLHHLKSIHHSKTTSQMTTDSLQATIQLQEIDETVNILSDGVTTLNEDRQRLSNESIHQQQILDSLTKDCSTLKISIQEQNAFLDGTKVNQEILQQDLASMGQKITDMKTGSYDGTLYWKIINVQESIGQQFMLCLAFF